MLDGRVLEASQVEYNPFGKPPLQREGLPCATALHKAQVGSTPSTGSTPSAGHRMGRGKGLSFARGGSLGLRTCSITPEATRLSKLVGCALSSLWQSPHSACKVCTLPAACLTGTTWSSSQVPARRQPAAAQRALAVLRGQGLLPLRRAFALSSFKKILCAKPARRWPLCSCLSALHHLRSTSCFCGSWILVPRLSLSPQFCAGLLMATFKLAPRLPQVLAPEQLRLHVRGVEAPLLDGRQGLPRLAPEEHARRLPLQHPLHGPAHKAVPSKHTVRCFSAGS